MNSNREEALFAFALEKLAEKRAAFLDAVCEGDTALRARLEALLAAHEQPGKTLNATRAQFWLRVDGKGNKSSDNSLAFDNMDNRPVVGTADWTKCELVLDVTDDAATINLQHL